MSFQPPDPSLIQSAFPEIRSLTFHRQGGFKAVYKTETGTGTEAFKLLCLPKVTEGALDRDLQEMSRKAQLGRALREVSILGDIDIPEIVKLGSIKARIADVGGLECLGYSEEWLDGENLWDILRSPSRVPPSEAECRRLLECLVTAIHALWKLDKIHRDIKPLNVMRLSQEGRPFVLLDLGIAYDLSEPGLTYNTAFFPCTYRYLAPEMTEPKFRERLDFRSDLYTTGLTVYEFASGRHPIAQDMDDMVRTITRALHDLPPPLHSLRPDFSEPFCSLVDQLLRKKPMLRPGNLEQLQKRIRSLS